MPVRNAAATVAIAVRSVLHSRGVTLELVCVDHASTDDTRAILGRFPSVRVVDAPGDVDVAAALELGRAHCTAPFVARMDGDDVMHPDRLRAHVDHLTQHAATAAIASRAKLIPRARARGSLASYVAWQNATISVEDHAREIWIEQPLCQPATTFRASALASIGGYRAQPAPYPEDYDLFLRFVVAGLAIEKLPLVHHAWRAHDTTTTRIPRDVLARMKARALIAKFDLATRAIVIAGAGKEGARIARALSACGTDPSAFVDVAARRIGTLRRGVPVYPATDLARFHAAGAFLVAAVGTSGSRGVVRAQLVDAGFTECVDAVVVA